MSTITDVVQYCRRAVDVEPQYGDRVVESFRAIQMARQKDQNVYMLKDLDKGRSKWSFMTVTGPRGFESYRAIDVGATAEV